MPSLAVVDAGILVAWAHEADPRHTEVLRTLRSTAWTFVFPALPVAEACYIIASRFGAEREAQLIEAVAMFEVVAPTTADLRRMAQLIRQYADFPLGAADASVIALAERFETPYVVTFDYRHFRTVRPSHVESLTLIPEV